MAEEAFTTRVRAAGDPDAIEEAFRLLGSGACIGLPTETVYGLAADATNGRAVANIFSAKGRPSFNPLICHVPDQSMAGAHAVLGPIERALADRFWPGPLTLICRLRPESPIHPLATAGLATVGLRSPQGLLADLAGRLGRPLAAPSANASGRVSPTDASHVAASLNGRIPLVLDGGVCEVGVESTIVLVENERIVLLRPGGITRAALSEVSGLPVVAPGSGDAIIAPGQLTSHYAPAGRVRLDVQKVEVGEALIAFGPAHVEGQEDASVIVNLSPSGDLQEAAANLFSALARLDREDIGVIAVVPIPFEGIGEAMNDRLRRAAAPRD